MNVRMPYVMPICLFFGRQHCRRNRGFVVGFAVGQGRARNEGAQGG